MNDMQQLQPNTTLQDGKYKIERLLGQGGFGITYLATQVSLNRNVAIKEFFMKENCQRATDDRTMTVPSDGSRGLVDGALYKFRQEALKLASISHPNIVRVIDVFEENGTAYYVMDYLPGGSLTDKVKTGGPMTEEQAMGYIRQIASALKYMHEVKHMCHFDVKPSNIMLDAMGNAFLIDFGISKNYGADGRATSSMPVGISEGYAPIEQYSQLVGDFSPESDVYSLGATLYYLVTGKVPPASVVRASGQELQFPASVSTYIRGLISSAMSVSRNSRPTSVDMFLQSNNPNMVYNEDPATLIIEKPRIKMEDNNNGDLLDDNGEGKKGTGNVKVVVMILSLLLVAGLVVALFFSNSTKRAEPVDTSLDSTAVEVSGSAAESAVEPLNENSNNSDNNSSYSNENGLHLYQGKIGNLSITMFLNPNAYENEVAGYYKYNNSQINTKFELVVVRRYQNRLILNEYRPDGFNCGTYDGYIEDGGVSYSGSFVNSEGKEFSFSVYRE